MMHITGKESTNTQENCERKPKKKPRRERERERNGGSSRKLVQVGNQRCEMTIKRHVFDPSEHRILPWQIKSEFTYTKVFEAFTNLLLALPFRLETWGMNPVSELLRWRDFDIKTWG
jgi:hypothetical protein